MSSAAAPAKTALSPSSVITASGDKALFSRLQAGLEGALPNEARTRVRIAYSHGFYYDKNCTKHVEDNLKYAYYYVPPIHITQL